MSKKRKILVIIVVSVVALILAYVVAVLLLNRYSVPDKAERLKNLKLYCEQDRMDKNDVPREVEALLSKYTNWDNLFLSNHFKEKFKNRKNIIDDASRTSEIWCGSSNEDDEVIVYVYKTKSLFSSNDSEDIATEYIFKYVLDDNGEIDDLIRIDKFDVYVINGEPVE